MLPNDSRYSDLMNSYYGGYPNMVSKTSQMDHYCSSVWNKNPAFYQFYIGTTEGGSFRTYPGYMTYNSSFDGFGTWAGR